jgi:hypothetical protein
MQQLPGETVPEAMRLNATSPVRHIKGLREYICFVEPIPLRLLVPLAPRHPQIAVQGTAGEPGSQHVVSSLYGAQYSTLNP